MQQYHKFFKIIMSLYLCLTLLVIFITTINLVIYFQTKNFILPYSSMIQLKQKKDFAIVLGASVHGERLSHALKDRVDAAINLYQKGLVKYILMSGDGIGKNYNETLAMKKFALKHGVPEDVIFTDTKGFNTYASILRAKNIYRIENTYIISQEFHIGRAVWIARRIGMDAQGVSVGKFKILDYYTFREIFARPKDFLQILMGGWGA